MDVFLTESKGDPWHTSHEVTLLEHDWLVVTELDPSLKGRIGALEGMSAYSRESLPRHRRSPHQVSLLAQLHELSW